MNIVSNSRLSLRGRQLSKVIKCQFSQSECCQNKYAKREAKFFGKLTGTSVPKKKKLYMESDIGTKPSLKTLAAVGSGNRTSKENSRRVHVLNKLFMRNITDLMVTEKHSAELIGRGLEISRVAVASDFSKVYVYWLAGEKEVNGDIEKLLFNMSLSLRHELSQLRIMGVVPRIEFVKDKHYARVMKVENLLNTLDLTEDVEVPIHPEVDIATAATIGETDEQEECVNINEKNQRSKEEKDRSQEVVLTKKQIEIESPLPPMQHSTLNLDHSKIMHRIINAVDRSKALHRKDPNIAPPPSSSSELSMTSDSDEVSNKELRGQFTKFLLQRKILREKVLKKEKKYGPDIQLPAQNIENELPLEFLKYNEPYGSEQDHDYIEEEVNDEANNK